MCYLKLHMTSLVNDGKRLLDWRKAPSVPVRLLILVVVFCVFKLVLPTNCLRMGYLWVIAIYLLTRDK